jgi:hypothetical protein
MWHDILVKIWQNQLGLRWPSAFFRLWSCGFPHLGFWRRADFRLFLLICSWPRFPMIPSTCRGWDFFLWARVAIYAVSAVATVWQYQILRNTHHFSMSDFEHGDEHHHHICACCCIDFSMSWLESLLLCLVLSAFRAADVHLALRHSLNHLGHYPHDHENERSGPHAAE